MSLARHGFTVAFSLILCKSTFVTDISKRLLKAHQAIEAPK